MFQQIIAYSVKNKLIVFLLVLLIVIGGVYSMRGIPLDAVPDITNNQVQVVTVSPTLAAEEVEQLITFPIEASISNLPGVREIRSISRYGLSVITVVVEEDMPMLDARQYVKEQLSVVEIPPGLGNPELMPITTGLGEIYQYVLEVEPGYEERYDNMELRTIQDWIVKRQLAGIPGVIEVSSFGGYLKQYQIAVDPEKLYSLKLTVTDVLAAIEQNNENSGGSYIEDGTGALYIRTFGRVEALEDIESILIAQKGKLPVYVRDVATVNYGSPNRYGAMTMDGKGEVVGGITLMLKGSNSSATIANVQTRVEEISSALPEGVKIYPYLDRSELIGRAIDTVEKNLIEGGLIVIFVLVLLLGNWRGGIIVASVIPLSMLFAFMLMRYFGVSANLMSLGAIDFGIVVDGAVIIVEGVLHALYTNHVGRQLSQQEMDDEVINTSGKIYNSAAFGVLIILVVFVPIMTLTGIEGKMFRPMAYTVSFAIFGAMILSLTYVPVISSMLLSKKIKDHHTFSDKIVEFIRSLYRPSLEAALKFPKLVIGLAIAFLFSAIVLFMRMGGEFIPTLEEGDLAMQMTIQPGSSLSESIRTSTKAEKILLDNFPEVKHVVSKIGTAEVPTDPMAIEDADIMIILAPKDEWETTDNREDLVAAMKEKLSIIVGASFDFTQPIQLRFNELMTGAKTDIAIQIFGESTERLAALANETAEMIRDINGVGDVKVEQTEGLPQLMITYDRRMLAQYGVSVSEVNTIIKSAYAGVTAGQVFENERQFDLVVRYKDQFRSSFDLSKLWVRTDHGSLIPLSQVAQATYRESPLQISREQAKRRINVGVNVRNRDVASLVADLQDRIGSELRLPPGYRVTYGGQFENLEQAKGRLQIAVPLALLMILILLYFTFKTVSDSLIIFMAVPFSAIGGVYALWLRDMPFSISAGVGFIALFGVSVLNGIVLIQYYKQLQEEEDLSLTELVMRGGLVRMRPVIMTAAVASLGFLPMALSTTAGGEVQRPLATVVIGGLVTSTLLTLIVLPVIYRLVHERKLKMNKGLMILLLLGIGIQANAQTTMKEAETRAMSYYNSVQLADLDIAASKAQKKQVYNPGNLNVGVSYGEINAGVNDYNISIMQSLGNIPQSVAQAKASGIAVEMAEVNKLLVQRWLVNHTRNTYLSWVSSGLKYELIGEQMQLYMELNETAERAVIAGDRSSLETTLIRQEYTSLKNEVIAARLEYETQRSQLVELTGIPADSLQLPEDLPVVQWNGDTTLASVFRELYAKRAELGDQQVRASKLGYFPSFSVGYFNQQLEQVSGFQGVQFGVSLPLWFKPQQSKVQQSEVVARQTVLENEMKLNQLEQGLRSKLTVLRSFELEKTRASDTQMIVEARNALDAGEIDLFDFTRFVNQHFSAEKSAIDVRAQYYKIIADIKYYTE
ncbi:CusA/CzcA family heavy metal efflux RND transporter [Marinoscillum sp.]|uniref:CusA/CzcA family heavy metal efflux RND transporter n=1 Tax=Marinoscillum sp. TaxID=2024838 RepID=UPI003BA8C457